VIRARRFMSSRCIIRSLRIPAIPIPWRDSLLPTILSTTALISSVPEVDCSTILRARGK